MFSFGTNDRRNKCFLKYGDSAWSKVKCRLSARAHRRSQDTADDDLVCSTPQPLSFETVAADLEVLVETANGQQEIHTGLSYIEGLGKVRFSFSRLATLARPRLTCDVAPHAV